MDRIFSGVQAQVKPGLCRGKTATFGTWAEKAMEWHFFGRSSRGKATSLPRQDCDVRHMGRKSHGWHFFGIQKRKRRGHCCPRQGTRESYLRVAGRPALIADTLSSPAILQIGCEKSFW